MSDETFSTYQTPVGVRIRQLPGIARRAITHPRWLLENGRLLIRRRQDEARVFSLDDYLIHRVSELEALAALVDVGPAELTAAGEVSWWPAVVRETADGGRFASWDGTPELLRAVAAAVRVMRPNTVVEIGVARGMSSAVILAALRENGHGHLFSLDLPPLLVDPETFVGSHVPENLRDRWSLELGPSRLLMRPLLERLGTVDILVHDGDHTYPSQIEELRLGWRFLRPGGLVIVDDVWCNSSFFDFADEVGVRPYFVMGSAVESALGILGRPH